MLYVNGIVCFNGRLNCQQRVCSNCVQITQFSSFNPPGPLPLFRFGISFFFDSLCGHVFAIDGGGCSDHVDDVVVVVDDDDGLVVGRGLVLCSKLCQSFSQTVQLMSDVVKCVVDYYVLVYCFQ